VGEVGEPFSMVESSFGDVLAGLGNVVLVVNDPPWSGLAGSLPPPASVVQAWDMDLAHLEAVAAGEPEGDVVVGLGGGTAMDTAKFLAWKSGRPLVQIPSITSVDAGFTDAVGVRVDGNVRYVGKVRPETVVLDVDLVRSAPAHLNRAGIGDILSCAVGLHDWRLAAARGAGQPWDEPLARLGERLLADLSAARDEIAAVSADGVRFLAESYRTIGAACAAAGHSRFEEGSEHFWAYAYEWLTGAHPVHGEIISFGVVVMSFLQANDPDRWRGIVADCRVRAHPADIGISREDFDRTFSELKDYVRRQELDHSIIDEADLDRDSVDGAWDFVSGLPRQGGRA
jgi:glycerol-1-phosphate dehydrogenase [NAD(P)+]